MPTPSDDFFDSKYSGGGGGGGGGVSQWGRAWPPPKVAEGPTPGVPPFGGGGGGGGGGERFAMVTALASHQCGLGSQPGVDTICGLSLLLFRSPASRGFFSSEYFGFPLSPQTTLWNSNRSGTHRHKRGLKNSVFRGEKKLRFKGSCALIVLDIWFLFNF